MRLSASASTYIIGRRDTSLYKSTGELEIARSGEALVPPSCRIFHREFIRRDPSPKMLDDEGCYQRKSLGVSVMDYIDRHVID